MKPATIIPLQIVAWMLIMVDPHAGALATVEFRTKASCEMFTQDLKEAKIGTISRTNGEYWRFRLACIPVREELKP